MSDSFSSHPSSPDAESSLSRFLLSTHNSPLGFISASGLNTTAQDESASADLATLAESILADSTATRRLSERVVEMLRLELYQQRDRGNHYR
ncbi:MAG: hypothetical protein AAGD09_06350 [Cyanobacteria bacterium P01_F01_bin.56]